MKYCSNICSICGTNNSKATFIKVGVTATDDHLRSQILLMWKRECIKSLCDVLFDSKCPDLFLEYFQQGMNCPDCLQIIRDLDFTWKQFMECKRRIEKQSTKVRTLLTRNYQNGNHKSEAAVIEARISGLPDNFVDDYSAKEVLEMIYSVIHSNRGISKVVNQDVLKMMNSVTHSQRGIEKIISGILKTEGPTEFLADVNIIKEELTLESNEDFDSGDDDWQSENIADKTDVKSSAALKRKKCPNKGKLPRVKFLAGGKLEVEYPKGTKRRRHSLKSYAINEEEESDTELQSEDDQFDQSNDKEWKPPSNYSPYKLTEQEKACMKHKRKQELHKLLNNEFESDNSVTVNEDINVNDNNFESLVRKAKKFKRKEFKNYLSKEKNRKGNRDLGLKTDIILDNSELNILKKLSALKFDWKQFRTINDSELKLALKISEYSMTSIERLNLPKEQIKGVLKLRARVMARERKKKNRPVKPQIEFPCTEENCSEKLKSEEELEGHIRGQHKGESLPFYCTTCPKKYSTYNNVRSHRQNIHNGIMMSFYHFCKICQKGYKMEEEIKSHSETAHQGQNPFCCAFCDAECTTSWDLVRHMNESHPEVTPEKISEHLQKPKCDKCGKNCSTERKLIKHMKIHENEKLFKCDKCQRTFPSESSLKVHIDSVHTSIVCDICGKSINRHGFSSHMDRHNGISKYECKICNRRFKCQSHLSNHERIHSGIRSFVCPVCGKAFFTKIILDGHVKIHEPGYVPRKPNRRTKPNRKKIIQQPNPEPESPGGGDSLTLAANQHSEAFLGEQNNLHINNSAIAHRPSNVDYKYTIDHTSGFVYHHM